MAAIELQPLYFPLQWNLNYPGVPASGYCKKCGALNLDEMAPRFIDKLRDAYKFVIGCCCPTSSTSGSSGSSTSTSSGSSCGCTGIAGIDDCTAPSVTWNASYASGGCGSGSCSMTYQGIGSVFGAAPVNTVCGTYSSCTPSSPCSSGYWTWKTETCGGGPNVFLYVGRCCCAAEFSISYGFLGGANGSTCNCSDTSLSSSASCGVCAPTGTFTKA